MRRKEQEHEIGNAWEQGSNAREQDAREHKRAMHDNYHDYGREQEKRPS